MEASMQLTLNEELSKKLQDLKEKHKGRGLRFKNWNAVLNQLLLEASDEIWSEAIEAQISEKVLIKEMLEDPQARQKMLEALGKNRARGDEG